MNKDELKSEITYIISRGLIDGIRVGLMADRIIDLLERD